MTKTQLTAMLGWAEAFEPRNGLVMAKALWSGVGKLNFAGGSDKPLIIIPPEVRRRTQPFTLAFVLHPGTGYRDLQTGEWEGPILAAGDLVVADQYVAYELEFEGSRVNFLPESRCLAVVRDYSLDTLLELVE